MAKGLAVRMECAGIESLESDHLKMMALANELHDSVCAHAAPEAVAALIDQLAAYTEAHFACEEKLLVQMGSPDAAEHRHEHENMSAWIAEMRMRLKCGSLPVASIEVVGYLRDWILEHVVRSDQSYLSELAARERW
ncbi:MAG TPA: bacteriohemerythrin [Terracidiphilus sp.]|nr:bacteriohemerythrin [Terracidiphilus sp.]